MTSFGYPCPDCRSRTDIHDPDCEFGGRDRVDIERAYVDIVAELAARVCPARELRQCVPGEWTRLHGAALEHLERTERVEEREHDALGLVPPEERAERVAEPTHEPVRTIYQEGSFPGCHDNSVFAMVSYYEMVGLSWGETRERVVEWLRESGAWERGGFEEGSPEELVDAKRHVYEAGYGWKDKATAAKNVIDRRRGGDA